MKIIFKSTLIIFKSILIISTLTITLLGCGNSNQESTNNSSPIESEKISPDKTNGLSAELLGNYHGIQPSYFMKNQYGDDMVINGNKVSVPSIDYKFLIKDNFIVNLQQINLDDNSRVFYDGTYKIISEEGSTSKIECSLSDGQGSKPTYVLTINKSDKKGICTGSNEPEFNIEKN
ncbi:MAG: hypothetical protein ACKO7P_12425 [Bacteroidota bacterium]